jgi:flagella basal body P-ring formation protein FlgA
MFLLLFLPFLLFAEVIENNITSVYKQTFKYIKIQNLTLQYYGKKPKKITSIDTSNINTKQPQGIVKINNSKFIHYKIIAKIKILKSIKTINNNEKITQNNSKLSWTPLKSLYKLPLTKIPINSAAKMYIPNNHIIYQYMITAPNLIRRNSPIKVISKSGGIEMSFDATAMQKGKVGDTIKVKDKNNNIYKVKIDKNGNGIL